MHRYSEAPNGPNWGPFMSRWSLAERIAVRVGDGIEKTIVFIGRAAQSGEFVPYGTGFISCCFQDDEGYQNIITARHVIEQLKGAPEILVRVNTREGNAKALSTKPEHWFSFDEKVDLSFCPMSLSPDIFDILLITLDGGPVVGEETIQKHDFGLGEDVFICGMYISRIGENRNLPIIRSGVLSAMPSEMVRTSYGHHHVYLIEARSTGGLSGSPVFLQVPPFRFVNEHVKHSAGMYPSYFLGMVLGHNKLSYPPELIEFLGPDLIDPEDRAEEEKERSIPLNTGIAIVLPASYILEAMMHPWIVEMRRKAAKQKRDKSGYVADGVIPISPTGPSRKDVPDEPRSDHREAFNRLVGAAARKRPPSE